MNKSEAWADLYVWNLNIDRLIRVLQRLEPHNIRSRRELRAYAIRPEEIRAGLNADFAERWRRGNAPTNSASGTGERH